MKFFLFAIVAIVIAASNTQETALGTEYLRAHANASFSSNSAINAQIIDVPPPIVVAADDAPPITTTLSPTKSSSSKTLLKSSTLSGTSTASTTKGDSDEHADHHLHDSDDQDAVVTLDLHKFFDLIKEEIHGTEEHILAAIGKQNVTKPAMVLKSYRTAAR